MAKDSLKTKLTGIQYHVTQECGTEPPFQNEFWNNKEPGLYVDIVSGEPLFSSTHKFDSGTGWPSFYRPLQEDNIIRKDDYTNLLHRIEVRSREGNSHLGHLFNDGPDPTGLRYCINSAALRFIPAARLVEEGYGEYADLFTAPSPAGEASGKATDLAAYATLGGGCFWCLEAVFERIDGVIGVVSGYAGGSAVNPTYTQVCSGSTGHAEVVRIQYDPARLSYQELLELFWKAHDPTTLNRQGADTGTQYRSIILYESEEQKLAAEQSILKQQSKTGGQIVTELVPLAMFYPAEEYHQDYFEQNRQDSYCRIVIEPKLEKLKLAF